MRKVILLSLILFSLLNASAQKKQNIYFLLDNGEEILFKDSADYIRVIEEPDSGAVFFNIKEFYPNGTKKLLGKVSSFDPHIVYEGVVVSYFKSGIKKSSITYKKNVPEGIAYYFFEDGRVKKQIEYLESDPKVKVKGGGLKLIYQVDTLGQVYVKDGNGHLIERTINEKDTLIEEGDYKDGFKEGIWKGRYTSGKSSYIEEYGLAKFISGTQTIGDKIYEYAVLEVVPDFKGGINEFYKYLGRSIKYPEDALSRNITGTVIVKFAIEEDGRIVNAEIVRSVYPSIDKETLRLILGMPKWKPGILRGIPVKMKYSLPVNLA